MHHPFHEGSVEIPRHHFGLAASIGRALVGIDCARGRETELLLQLAFHRHNCRDIDTEGNLEMKARRNLSDIFSETLDDRYRVARYRVIRRPNS